MSNEIPVFEKEANPNFKYKSAYAIRLYHHILNGGTFESFICYQDDDKRLPPITRTTKQNWYKTIPEFANARHLAEDRKQNGLDRALYSNAMGIKQKPQLDEKGEIVVDPSKQSLKAQMFLANTLFKRSYSKRDEVVVSNPDGSNIFTSGDVEKALEHLTDEELDEYIRLKEKMKGNDEGN